MKRRCLLALRLVALFLLAPSITHAQQAPTCQFVLGFKTLQDLAPSDVGDCVEDEAYADNGDAQQHTTKGLMVWRKADNWTAFTDGYRTWLNGPTGLAVRLNTERYIWESDYNAAGVIKIVPQLAPNGLSWTVAFDRNLVLPTIDVADSSGHVIHMPPKGRWVNVYFRVRNNKATSQPLSSDAIALVDKQGRKYVSDFNLRQIGNQGQEMPFPGSVGPAATLSLRLTFDVAVDASGGVLHTVGGNDIAAL